jgi:hypothetical protein
MRASNFTYLPFFKIRFAFASIFALLAGLRLPFFTCCAARALAFAAWAHDPASGTFHCRAIRNRF